jgi:hypothetical protein
MLVEYLVPYVISNIAAAVMLVLAFRTPRVARGLAVALFAWAAFTNARIALSNPEVYLEYADLTQSGWYRDFIDGWFSRHITPFVLAIAAGQAAIAVLLTRKRQWRSWAVTGAVVFLSAIAPLGVGAAFPFSLTLSAALLVAHRRIQDAPKAARPGAREPATSERSI